MSLWLTVCGSRTVSRVLSQRLPVCDRHSSRSTVARTLKQPTRKAVAGPAAFPIWSCSERGMPSMPRHRGIWWSLTPPFHPYPTRVGRFAFCGAVRGSPLLGVTQRSALWSPDFPPRALRPAATVCPTPTCCICSPAWFAVHAQPGKNRINRRGSPASGQQEQLLPSRSARTRR